MLIALSQTVPINYTHCRSRWAVLLLLIRAFWVFLVIVWLQRERQRFTIFGWLNLCWIQRHKLTHNQWWERIMNNKYFNHFIVLILILYICSISLNRERLTKGWGQWSRKATRNLAERSLSRKSMFAWGTIRAKLLSPQRNHDGSLPENPKKLNRWKHKALCFHRFSDFRYSGSDQSQFRYREPNFARMVPQAKMLSRERLRSGWYKIALRYHWPHPLANH